MTSCLISSNIIELPLDLVDRTDLPDSDCGLERRGVGASSTSLLLVRPDCDFSEWLPCLLPDVLRLALIGGVSDPLAAGFSTLK